MHFYIRHIGDYARDTANLSALEVGVYDLMLDFYYSTEQPLPLNRTDLKTLARSRNVATVRAMDKVLTEFFQKTERGYTHHRVEEELAKARSKSSKAAAAAAARWEAEKRDANASKGDAKKHANAYANASPENMRTHRSSNASQKPVVNLKPQPIVKVSGSASRTRAQESSTHTPDSTAEDDPAPAPNPAAVISRTMREHGIAKAAPSNVRIVALAEAGVSEARVIEACDEAHATHPDEAITANYVCSILEAWQRNGHGSPRIVKANGHGPPLTPVQQREADRRAVIAGVYGGIRGNTGEVIDIEAKETGNARRLKNS
jgi:uncharacterized protein YdaU (DUF1376 family)